MQTVEDLEDLASVRLIVCCLLLLHWVLSHVIHLKQKASDSALRGVIIRSRSDKTQATARRDAERMQRTPHPLFHLEDEPCCAVVQCHVKLWMMIDARSDALHHDVCGGWC